MKIATGINSRNYVNKKGHDTLQDLFAKAGEPGNKTKFVETLLQSSQKGGNAEVMDTLLRAIQVKKGTEGAVPIEIGFKQIYQKTVQWIEILSTIKLHHCWPNNLIENAKFIFYTEI